MHWTPPRALFYSAPRPNEETEYERTKAGVKSFISLHGGAAIRMAVLSQPKFLDAWITKLYHDYPRHSAARFVRARTPLKNFGTLRTFRKPQRIEEFGTN